MNNRRKLVIALGASALAAPLRSFAQQTGKTYRIGYLGGAGQAIYARLLETLRGELRARGYVAKART